MMLPVGKLPLEYLPSLLKRLPKQGPRVVVSPRVGEDAAVIDAGDRYIVVATDPVTFAIDQIGRYAVHVNANDVAVLGARPLWFFVAILLPESRTTPQLAETIMADVGTTCEELGVTVCGGHTEITQGLDRPILVGQMLGEVTPTRLVQKTRITPGDLILLTRGVAIEGAAILAREKSEWLRGPVDAQVLARASRLLIEPASALSVRLSRLPISPMRCTACTILQKADWRQGSSSWSRLLVSGCMSFVAKFPFSPNVKRFATRWGSIP